MESNISYYIQIKSLNYGKIGSILGFILIAIGLFSCTHEQPETTTNMKLRVDTIQKEFIFTEKKDTTIKNGEYIKYNKNGKIEIHGMMKNGRRDGVWKSYYEDGSPWSETTFVDGKRHGKTITWYNNNKKRYEGFYANDLESGHWIFWDENGKIQNTKNY